MSKIPMYQTIHDDILKDIVLGMYAVGDRLMTEREVSERYQVSRITSKKALELLEQEGVIVRRQGAGSYVNRIPESMTDLTGGVRSEAQKETGTVKGRQTIGVIFDNFDFAFGCNLLKSISWECSKRGIYMYFRCSYEDIALERQCVSDFLELGVSGLIIMCVHNDVYDDSILRLVVDDFPVILVDRDMANIDIPSVTTDNFSASRELAGIMLDRGHKVVSFVTHANDKTNTIFQRLSGIERAHADRGILFSRSNSLFSLETCTPSADDELDWSHIDEDSEKIERFMKKRPDVNAFLCAQYQIGNIMMHVANRLGRQNEVDVSFFDGPVTAHYERPFFGRILQDEKRMGSVAVEYLLKRIQGESVPKSTYIPHRILLSEDEDCF